MERQKLERPRARREAAKALGVAMAVRYRRFLESAGDEDATVVATGDLAQCMYENVEFIIWALKHLGGLNPPPPDELRKITPPKPKGFINPHAPGADEALEEAMNQPVTLDLPCNCPPMEPGIIGYKHMASCPKFVPA